ncbi:probable deoxyhypusine synthase [Schistocerca cancellata]|uniref:probable deoxyhypusine synthase n=1 Tax=Schistocerca cancellata TaxID=274614 RepID=UPI002117E34E|nr:probable deoxyhypusine synthase [Schistocerca cancellata]
MSGSTEVKEICEKGDDVEEKDKCTIVRGNVGLTEDIPEKAKSAVLVESAPLPEGTPIVQGYDFNKGVNYHALLETFRFSGFQATNFGLAVEEIKRMITCRRQLLSEELQDKLEEDEFIKRKTNCTIFFGYTSNMISAGVRDTIRFLVQHNLVDCVVTTAGGIEEDFIKCLAPTYIGDFHLDGRRLREKGINRIGNLLVPNENYCRFEDWVMPILDKMLQEQKEKGTLWTPSKMVARLGEEINNPDSVYYWAAKNKIPVFSPALTDGSLGDMMYFHSYKNPGLVLDIIQDLRRLNTMAVKAANTGMIIIGGGVIKHHICNANLMRNGADYAVFINTASEFDGSDSGARPDEAISWGKIRKDASPVKVYAEASLVFPLLVGETFAKQYHATKEKTISDV